MKQRRIQAQARRHLAPLLVASSCIGCMNVTADPGRDGWLSVENAQFRPGPLPDDAGGPQVTSLFAVRPIWVPGQDEERVTATMAPGASAFAVGLEDDVGTWLLPAGAPSVDTPDAPSGSVAIRLSSALPPGRARLGMVAFDQDGVPGALRTLDIDVVGRPPPSGTLVVSLEWSGPADLDLHVVDPLGGEAWAGDPNTWIVPPPGQPIDPNAWQRGGIFSGDGNAACRRDAFPAEHVAWRVAPPPGEYVVRVDAPSLCGASLAPWAVTVRQGQTVVSSQRGWAFPADTLGPHGAGSGALAVRFSLP